jgi:hypothetical protein
MREVFDCSGPPDFDIREDDEDFGVPNGSPSRRPRKVARKAKKTPRKAGKKAKKSGGKVSKRAKKSPGKTARKKKARKGQ